MKAKRFFQWVSLILVVGMLAIGCRPDSPVAQGGPTATQPIKHNAALDSHRLQEIKDSLAVLASAPDTFRASNKQVFRMHSISKAQYATASGSGRARGFPVDSAATVATEKAFMQAEAGRVWRAGATLCFQTNKGSIIRLHDGPTYQDAEDSYEGYRYLANLATIQQWLVEVGQWEGKHYLLVDQQTGKETRLISYPVISPNHTHFVCANSDPTGYSLDGLQLWQKPVGRPPKLLWQRISNATQSGITALSPRWKDDHTIYFYEDFTSAGRYMRIRF